MRNRDKKKVVGIALFIHVLDKLPEVSLFGGGDVGAKGGREKVAVVGLKFGHGFSFLNIDVFESKDGAGLSLRQFKVEQLQTSGEMLNDGFALCFVCLGRRCAFKVLDCLAEGLQEFGLKVGGECHGFSLVVGLIAFEICTVDHHPDDAVLKGEDHGFGGSRGDRASVTGGDQSIVAPADDYVVLVVELENSNGKGLCFFVSEGHGFFFQL
jgi:hypothetical protein